MDRPIIIGISGGTGVGKSTVSFALRDKYPDKISVVHFDDYQKRREDIPLLYNMRNRDHPDAIDFEQLMSDIQKLKDKQTIIIQTRNETDNKNYRKSGLCIPLEIKPKPVVLVEGYLLFWNAKIRGLLDKKFFLDLDYKTRIKRRTKFTDEKYNKRILVPMQKKFIEPTKKYADFIIDVSKLSKKRLISKVETKIKKYFK